MTTTVCGDHGIEDNEVDKATIAVKLGKCVRDADKVKAIEIWCLVVSVAYSKKSRQYN